MSTENSRWIDREITDALDSAFDAIEDRIRSGALTDPEVTDALRKGWDEAVLDAWEQYAEEVRA